MSAATRSLRAVVGRSYRLSRTIAIARMARALPAGVSPIVVCSMGKVGSTAIARAIAAETGDRVFQVFRLDPVGAAEAEQRYRAAPRPRGAGTGRFPGAPHLWETAFLANRPPSGAAPWRLIVPIREPVAQAVSACFHALGQRGVTGLDPVAARRELVEGGWFDRPARWLDREVVSGLGIDVYAAGPPPVATPLELANESVRLLVVRLEDSATTPAALGRFLGRSGPIPVSPRNRGVGRAYADAYRAFTANPGIPGEALEAAYASRYARFFYSTDEIAAFRDRWARAD